MPVFLRSPAEPRLCWKFLGILIWRWLPRWFFSSELVARQSPRMSSNGAVSSDMVSFSRSLMYPEPTSNARDFCVLPLFHELLRVVQQVSTLSVSAIAVNGTKRTVQLTEKSISRLRGNNIGLSWICDQSVNGLVYLINERSKRSVNTKIRFRSPSKHQDLFNGTRVWDVFGTYF